MYYHQVNPPPPLPRLPFSSLLPREVPRDTSRITRGPDGRGASPGFWAGPRWLPRPRRSSRAAFKRLRARARGVRVDSEGGLGVTGGGAAGVTPLPGGHHAADVRRQPAPARPVAPAACPPSAGSDCAPRPASPGEHGPGAEGGGPEAEGRGEGRGKGRRGNAKGSAALSLSHSRSIYIFIYISFSLCIYIRSEKERGIARDEVG